MFEYYQALRRWRERRFGYTIIFSRLGLPFFGPLFEGRADEYFAP